MPDDQQPTVSIIIKAFNEERHIAGAIESALAALVGMGGEVILADGASTDRTIAIAKKYPVKIVRLNDPADRSCGAGAQLGFQYSSGEFICLMDGDMRLQRPFLAAGIRALKEYPTLGGVGGAVIDHDADNLEYAQRVRRFDPDRQPGPVTRLGGCGIYRRAAIATAGYCTDRNLHGGEELELAGRLRAAGWTLARIDCPAVDHFCHTGNPYRHLLRRIRARNACGPGEIMRAVIGRPQFEFVARHDRNSMLCGLVGLWWCSIAAALLLGSGVGALLGAAALLVLPFAAMSFRWRSLRGGIYSVMVWNAHALCFLPGFLWPRKPPANWIASHVIKDSAADVSKLRVVQR
jgi:cellulose synthase/poly-beta-1,6-N-acetylglucosamine synthase-like glycosyltransferase